MSKPFKLIDDLSNPLEGIRSGLVTTVELVTRVRRLVKHPGRDSIFPEKSHIEGANEADILRATADLYLAREEFEEHVSNLLARLHECRAHAALASKALAKVIELSSPKINKETMS